MGIYFNPENSSFRQAVRSRIYVDKTGLIPILNRLLCTEDKCIALSHARRFGKSQAAGMIDAYYSAGCDSRELFSPFEIAQAPDFEEHLNKYNVIHVDVSSQMDNFDGNPAERIRDSIYRDIKKEYSDLPGKDLGVSEVLMHVYEKTARPFVIIIDEWDCVIREYGGDSEKAHQYLQFLHSLFKSEESKSFLALAYITGILPIKKIKNESALNNFTEYTMTSSKNLTPYFGFTESEVKGLCRKYDMEYESVKEWYDGYLIDGQHMYNPNSVAKAMNFQSLDSYWKNTSAFETVNEYIMLDFDGLRDAVVHMLEGEGVIVDTGTFQNDLKLVNSRDDALTALIHLGYLAYDSDTETARIPNYEVRTAFHAALATGRWKDIALAIDKCNKILYYTINKASDRVAEMLELSHETFTSVLRYNDENSLACAITMAYFTAPAYYTIIRELPAGKGFADIAMIPRREAGTRPPIIVELKWDEDADTAIKQIKDRRYTGALSGCGRDVLLVGISYSKDAESPEYKKHHCMIESVMMD